MDLLAGAETIPSSGLGLDVNINANNAFEVGAWLPISKILSISHFGNVEFLNRRLADLLGKHGQAGGPEKRTSPWKSQAAEIAAEPGPPDRYQVPSRRARYLLSAFSVCFIVSRPLSQKLLQKFNGTFFISRNFHLFSSLFLL